MRATIFLLFLCSFFICKGESSTLSRTQSCGAKLSLTQNYFIQNQGLTDNSDQFNKIIEDTDTGEDNLNSDNDCTKFIPLHFEATQKWYSTKSNSFILKDDLKGTKNFQPFFGYSQPIYIIIRVLRI
jgi:hypothetical protein